MKVKIVRCFNANFWYANKIGEEFYVRSWDDATWSVVPEIEEWFLIKKEDVEIINNKTWESDKSNRILEMINAFVQSPGSLKVIMFTLANKGFINFDIYDNFIKTNRSKI